MAPPARQIVRQKLVIVGDSGCGKTSLLIRYGLGSFHEGGTIPSTLEGYVADIELEDKDIEMALWDTDPGNEYNERFRTMRYKKAHVVLICFGIDAPDSLDSVQEKWIDEVMHFCRRTPIVLVGCKSDLRTDPAVTEDLARMGQAPVTREQGVNLAQKIGAETYLECSVKLNDGVNAIFQTAAQAALRSVQNRQARRTCSIF